MPTNHRYYITTTQVIYAETDAGAIEEAKSICVDEVKKFDNDCKLISITRHDFAELDGKLVYLENQKEAIK